MYVHAIDPAGGVLELPAELARTADARWADGSVASLIARPDGTADVRIPDALRAQPVAVLSVLAPS